jgi:hypothetical protein
MPSWSKGVRNCRSFFECTFFVIGTLRAPNSYPADPDLSRRYLGRKIGDPTSPPERYIQTKCDYCQEVFVDVIEFRAHLQDVTDPQVLVRIPPRLHLHCRS